MNIKLVTREEIDTLVWDQHLSTCHNAVLYACSWYLDSVCDRWAALVWQEGDLLKAIMPIPLKWKFGIWVVQQPFYCQYLGVFSARCLDNQVLWMFMDALCRSYRYISTYSFCPENGVDFLDTFQQQKNRGITSRIRHTHWLTIPENGHKLTDGYAIDRARNLRSALTAGWNTTTSKDPKVLIRLFRKYHQGHVESGVSSKAYPMLERLVALADQKGILWISYAGLADQIHAGILIIKIFGRAVYLFNASDLPGRAQHARTLLLHQYFRTVPPATVFDFESPEIRNIATFYKGFGSVATPYIELRQNRLPFPINHLQNLRRKLL